MNILLLILVIMCIAALLGVITWIIILIYIKEEEKIEAPFIINFMPQHTFPIKGYAIGLEQSTKKIDNRYLIEFSPRDINKENLKENKLVSNVKVVVGENKVITLPKGILSDNRTIKLLLAPTPEDYPLEFKNSSFGKIICGLTEAINITNDEVKIVREGSNRKTDILYKMGDGEISKETLNKFQEIFKDILKTSKDDKSNMSYMPPRSV